MRFRSQYHSQNQGPEDPQIILKGVMKGPTRTGIEQLVFSMPLGPLELTFLANIPNDGDETTVYVKFKFLGDRGEQERHEPEIIRNGVRHFDDAKTG